MPPEQLEFMDLRFYRTGTIAKAPIHPEDIADITALLERLQPAQIYVAGEMSDPHGTHRVCADAIFQAVRKVRSEGQAFEVWLYRGAWEEWEPHEIERVVPLSPDDLERKKLAIFRHQSQKDRAMFPGSVDRREFWQRAEDRNRTRPRCTISSACRSSTRWKVSSSGATTAWRTDRWPRSLPSSTRRDGKVLPAFTEPTISVCRVDIGRVMAHFLCSGIHLISDL